MRPPFRPARFAWLAVAALLVAGDPVHAATTAPAPVYRWTTIAGRASTGSEDGPVAEARFNNPSSLTQDISGNLFVADTDNHTIRKISPAGLVSTLAGKAGEPGDVDGAGATARFTRPEFLSADANGNVYVVESNRKTIRKITPAGVVSTIKGPDGAALSSENWTVAPDGTFYLWIGQTLNRFSGGQFQPITIALPATLVDIYGRSATFSQVSGPAIDAAGQLYFTTPLGPAKLNPDGTLTLVPNAYQGYFPAYVFNDCAGNLYQMINYSGWGGTPGWHVCQRLGDPDGTARAVFDLTYGHPKGASVGPNEVYFTQFDDDVVLRGSQTVYAGTSRRGEGVDGPAQLARFHSAQSLAVDSSGTVWISENTLKILSFAGDPYYIRSPSLRKLNAAGIVSTVVAPVYAPNGGPYEYASIYSLGLGLDGTGGVYFATWRNAPLTNTEELHVISAAGVDRLVGYLPDNTSLLLVDASHRPVIQVGGDIRRRMLDGNWETIAASTYDPEIKDGPKDVARFCGIARLATDVLGNIIVLDQVAYDNVTYASTYYVRRIAPDGSVKTLGPKRVAPDGKFPRSIAADSKGRIFLCYSDRIAALNEQGEEITIGGRDNVRGTTDGYGELARFSSAGFLTTDINDNLYVTDAWGMTLRKGVYAGIAPAITAQPLSVTVNMGGTAQFSVTASSTPAPTYQWYIGSHAITGATTSSFTLSSVRATDAGEYTVVVTNELGTVTSDKATLTVATNPTPPAQGSGGGGGGGAPSAWFTLALGLLVIARRCTR